MCGIVGFLSKSDNDAYPLGKTLYGMLKALGCRGPDSTGVALFAGEDKFCVYVAAPPDLRSETVHAGLSEAGILPHREYKTRVWFGVVDDESKVATLEERILALLPGCEVLCQGTSVSLFKQVGSPEKLEASYGIREWVGTHGIGHTRLSTESRVDLSHSQPFWAHGVPDLATVHNGHITNYHKLRRRYEQRGYRFFTENDSEVIGIYLRDRMAAGLSLLDALRSSLDDFDGSFSYLTAWKDGMAYVRDRYGFKPLMIAETDDWVALATEEIALRQALGDEFVAHEPPPGTMRAWSSKR